MKSLRGRDILLHSSVSILPLTSTGLGWDRVSFLHSSLHGAMFWICDRNSVVTRGVFWLLLSSADSIKALPVPHPTPPASSCGCTRSWEGTQPGQLGIFHATLHCAHL